MNTRRGNSENDVLQEEIQPAPWWVKWVFLATVPALLAQIPLRRFTEPYPAILLPSGASLLESRGEFTAGETELVVETDSGKELTVAASVVLDTVPSNYHGGVIHRGFGINHGRDTRSARIPLPGGGFTFQPVKAITPQQIVETKAWLREKIKRAMNVNAVRIRILSYDVTVIYRETPVRRVRTLRERETVELAEAKP